MQHHLLFYFKFLEVHLEKYGMKCTRLLILTLWLLQLFFLCLHFIVNFAFWFNLIWFWLWCQLLIILCFCFVTWFWLCSPPHIQFHATIIPLISLGVSCAWSNLWTLCICMQSYSIYRMGGGHHTNQPECSWMFTSLSTNSCMELEIT